MHHWSNALTAAACSFENVAFDGTVGVATGSGPDGTCAYRSIDDGESWVPWVVGLRSPAMQSAFDAFIVNSGLSKAIWDHSRRCTPA